LSGANFRGELGGWEEIEMGGFRISKSWLTGKLDPDDPEWSWALEQLCPDFEQGDELWHFDEPAPPGINAGAMGIAVVRKGEPLRTTITAIH
jgi:hypothetical protein